MQLRLCVEYEDCAALFLLKIIYYTEAVTGKILKRAQERTPDQARVNLHTDTVVVTHLDTGGHRATQQNSAIQLDTLSTTPGQYVRVILNPLQLIPLQLIPLPSVSIISTTLL